MFWVIIFIPLFAVWIVQVTDSLGHFVPLLVPGNVSLLFSYVPLVAIIRIRALFRITIIIFTITIITVHL